MADEMYHTHSSRAKRNLPLSHGDWSSTTAHRLDQQQAGDMIYATATTGALSRLGIGTAGQFLTVNSSGLPEWSSTVSSDRIFEDNIDIELGTGSDTLWMIRRNHCISLIRAQWQPTGTYRQTRTQHSIFIATPRL